MKFSEFKHKVNSMTESMRKHYICDHTPVTNEAKEQFDFIYSTIESPWKYEEVFYNNYYEAIINFVSPHIKDKHVIDLACGGMHVWIYAAKNGKLNCNSLIGYDVSDVILSKTRPIIHELGLEKTIKLFQQDLSVVSDLTSINMDANSIVYTNSALYYIPHKIRTQILQYICDNAGEMIITISSRANPDGLNDFPQHLGRDKWEKLPEEFRYYIPEMHCRYYGTKWLRKEKK